MKPGKVIPYEEMIKGDAMADKELKPCPLCDKDAEKTTAFGRKAIACTNCYLVIRSEYICTDNYSKLINQWNHRQPVTELVEAFLKYATHTSQCCRTLHPLNTHCDCGYFELRTKYRKEVE